MLRIFIVFTAACRAPGGCRAGRRQDAKTRPRCSPRRHRSGENVPLRHQHHRRLRRAADTVSAGPDRDRHMHAAGGLLGRKDRQRSMRQSAARRNHDSEGDRVHAAEILAFGRLGGAAAECLGSFGAARHHRDAENRRTITHRARKSMRPNLMEVQMQKKQSGSMTLFSGVGLALAAGIIVLGATTTGASAQLPNGGIAPPPGTAFSGDGGLDAIGAAMKATDDAADEVARKSREIREDIEDDERQRAAERDIVPIVGDGADPPKKPREPPPPKPPGKEDLPPGVIPIAGDSHDPVDDKVDGHIKDLKKTPIGRSSAPNRPINRRSAASACTPRPSAISRPSVPNRPINRRSAASFRSSRPRRARKSAPPTPNRRRSSPRPSRRRHRSPHPRPAPACAKRHNDARESEHANEI
jgi:hypothetical protein